MFIVSINLFFYVIKVISTGLELLGFQSDDMLVQHLIMKTYGFAQEQVLGNHILPQKLPNVPKKIRL